MTILKVPMPVTGSRGRPALYRPPLTETSWSRIGAFDTGDIAAGATVHFTAPSKPGTFPYRCNIHQFMTGTLTVSSS